MSAQTARIVSVAEPVPSIPSHHFYSNFASRFCKTKIDFLKAFSENLNGLLHRVQMYRARRQVVWCLFLKLLPGTAFNPARFKHCALLGVATVSPLLV